MKNDNQEIIIGNKLLFPICWAYSEKKDILKDNFSENIINFIPEKEILNEFCRETKIASNNIYLTTDPYNLFVYYDNKFLYEPLPFINFKIVKHLKIDFKIQSLKSVFKKYINRGSYIKIFDIVNSDVKLDLFIKKYFTLPDKQRISILEHILNDSNTQISKIPNEILDDIFKKFSKDILNNHIDKNSSEISCFSIFKDDETYHSSWLSLDSAKNYSLKHLNDSSIYRTLVSKSDIRAILNDNVFILNEKISLEDKIEDIIKPITIGEINRNGYKNRCLHIIDESIESVEMLKNFYTDNSFTYKKTRSMIILGSIQAMYCGLSMRDIKLLNFILSFTGLCIDNEEFELCPSCFLDRMYITNSLNPYDVHIAKCLIDGYILNLLNDDIFIKSYNVIDLDRFDFLKNLYVDIIALSNSNISDFDENVLSLRSSKRFISLWKNNECSL